MTARRISDAAPLRFLLAVICVWVAVRGTILMGWQLPDIAAQPARASEIHLPLDPVAAEPGNRSGWVAMATTTPLEQPQSWPMTPGHNLTVALDEVGRSNDAPTPPDTAPRPPAVLLAALAESTPAGGPTYRRADGEAEAAALAARPARAGSHWSGSAWAFLRGGGRATALSPGGQIGGGQIGGGQAGARLLYRLQRRGRLALSARVSRTIGGVRQTEAAAGLDWQPVASVPLHLMAERRIAIDRGGRDAWTLGAAGGLYAVPLGGHWRFDGYAEAGVVGTRRRDLYADGAARIARAIDLGAGRSLALGGGLWAAAQPRTTRVDVGPSAVLRLPAAGRTVALALDWRRQVAGHARPRSGVAFTTAVDF